MSIFDDLDKTPAQLVGEQVIKMGVNSVVGQANAYKRGWDSIWENPAGLTPQQVFDGMDTKALEFLTHAAHAKAMLLAVRPALLPEKYRDTPVVDGVNIPLNPEIVDGQPTGRMIVG